MEAFYRPSTKKGAGGYAGDSEVIQGDVDALRAESGRLEAQVGRLAGGESVPFVPDASATKRACEKIVVIETKAREAKE